MTTFIIIVIIFIILFMFGIFDKIIYPNDFKNDLKTNKEDEYHSITSYKKTIIPNKMEFNKLYTCEVEQDIACVLIFFKNGYAGIIDSINTPVRNDIKNEIIKHFEGCLPNPMENLSGEFGKYEISDKNRINIYFASKNEYFGDLDDLPFQYIGFEGTIENNYLALKFQKKWYNQSLKKSEISTASKSFIFKTI
ncbi:hypothetical protein [Paenimyroides aestuarii]|uniref:Uncharacterized protein n=1 Tax=Paenimyroides aestuarii TaxID=2968490 RepID=A0ABY5NTB7_9FLAO|nr:hypothetical protein [Paenimyroides aestuarii]UUV21820.1 hypothetical protein NPX36_01845 [Paenimyroides aestuarii]